MGGSDNEGSSKKDKKDKDKKHKDEKDKGKDDKHKDEKKDKGKDKGEKDKGKEGHKDKKDKGKDEKDKDKKDKGKEEKGKDKEKDKGHKDEKGKDKEKDKDKKDKKDKKDGHGEDGKKKDKEKEKKDKPLQPPGFPAPGGPVLGGEAASFYNPGAPPHPQPQLAQPPQSGEALWFLREPGPEVRGQPGPPRVDPPFPNPNPHYTTYQQPSQPLPSRALGDVGGTQPPQSTPPSGYRIPLDPNAQFPSPDLLGRPPTTDFDASTGPIFIGSAIFPDSVHPCKIMPSLHPACRVSNGGTELEHHGRYDLLPITQDMEWVPSGGGQLPPGRRPVEGGYEVNGGKLYHALGLIQGVHIPGKTGEHIVSRIQLLRLGEAEKLIIVETSQRGASIPFGGHEHILQENYSIL